ncbi:MAG: hypothetical protein HRT44_04970 [Bdellovibrionales bacterium]|nr:ATP-binding protein [Bdellovibrionales bacterium]NQZ18593.1 hypothetical protein [Bdellovibrionales bacterium]
MASRSKRQSLRRLVFTWFFLFTLVPLFVLAFVIQKQYQKSINLQIKDRLTIHVRELEGLFAQDRREMEDFLQSTVKDNSVVYYLSTREPDALKDTLQDKIRSYSQKEVKVYTHAGQVFVYFNRLFGSIHGHLDLSLELREKLESQSSIYRVVFQKRGKRENILALSIIQKISGVQQRTVGYIETVLPVDLKLLGRMNSSIGAEIAFFDNNGRVLLGTLPKTIDRLNLGSQFLRGQNTFFEFSVSQIPYAFISTAISWGSMNFLIGVGSSKAEAEISIRKVNYMIIFTFLSFLAFLSVMSFYFVREVISPIESLIRASKTLKETRKAPFIPNKSQTEIADLVDSFNEMSLQIVESDEQMQKQLELLELANNKIKKTQNQLVQSAKLASLGELVAGIAHELNNPIGFIYSNIGHLKNYSQSLFKIVDSAGSPDFDGTKNEEDYEYIKKDLPRLIQSCEEGSNRAKDIVLGLRNFSRADEEQTQPFDVNAGIDSTLQLIGGQIKNKINVVKNYNEVPILNCNNNQMKQVFMNILTNACQAMNENGGELHITTQYLSQEKLVEIRFKDTGTGIEKDNLEKIFDPFYTTKSVGEGTGLGLSISYGIIKSHGGNIDVTSVLDEGTEFCIQLPVYRE